MRPRSLLAALALVLVTASPAAAFSGAGVSARLSTSVAKPSIKATGFDVTGSGVARTHTCQASQRKAPKAVRTPAVVACEQPPRSEVTIPSAAQSLASAISQLG
jgi:hypothetical protein